MGMVQAEICLKNICDEGLALHGYIKTEEIRTATVTAIVDTGAMSLVITEELRQKLGLEVKQEKTVRIANGQRVPGKLTEAVEVRWKNREWAVQALVIPGADNILLGTIPLEGLDLMVNPVTQELTGVHGEDAEYLVLQSIFA
ncbi:MAG: aspartyl protease family protein [Synergistaceae bacterium]|nr:aspartyl protease family protein [Synergistaceae bacterium]